MDEGPQANPFRNDRDDSTKRLRARATLLDQVLAETIADPTLDAQTVATKLGTTRSHVVQALAAIRQSPTYMAAVRAAHPNNARRYAAVCNAEQPFWADVLDNILPPPVEFEVHPSSYCPLDCWYCCSPNTYGRSSTSAQDRNARIVSYMLQLAPHLRVLQVSGGREPLHDPHLHSILKTGRDLGLHMRLNTSGVTTIPTNQLSTAVTLLDHVAVSLDAPDSELYQSIKRISKPYVFQQVIEAVRSACAVSPRRARIEIAVLVLPDNLHHLARIARLGHEVGADAVRFRRLKTHTIYPSAVEVDRTPVHACSHWSSAEPPPEYLDPRVVLPAVLDIRDDLETPTFQVLVNKEDFDLDYSAYTADNRSPCYSANRRLVIDAQGNAFPCPLTAYPHSGTGHGRVDIYNANIMHYANFHDLWNAVASGIRSLHARSCATCYIADRYLNNYVARLASDRSVGIPISSQVFATPTH